MTAQRWLRLIGRMMLCMGFVILLHSLTEPIAGAIDRTSAEAIRNGSSMELQHNRLSQRSQSSGVAAAQPEMQPEMQPEYIDELAARTTVVIAQDLQAGDVETGQAFNPGSGAIVAKAGNLYFAVTNLHVVPLVNITYGVRTYDGEIYTVRPGDRVFGIYRLGEQTGETVSGLDIAIIAFESDRDYPVAGVNLSDSLARGDAAFVSGWPEPTAGQPMQRRFSPGQIANVAPPSPDGGYGLFYTSSTTVGMSGGPVFNHQGEVVGIHGRGSTVQTQGANQGIQANRVAAKAAEAKRVEQLLNRLDFVTRSPDPAVIAGWLSDRPATADTFDNPENAFREAFRASALRDCSPSRVDTGDPEDRCS